MTDPVQVFRDWIYDRLVDTKGVEAFDFHKNGTSYINVFPSGKDPQTTSVYVCITVTTDGYYKPTPEALKLEAHGCGYGGRYAARKLWTRYAKEKIEATPTVYFPRMVAWIEEKLSEAAERQDAQKTQADAEKLSQERRRVELTVERLGKPAKALAWSEDSENTWYPFSRLVYSAKPVPEVGDGVYTVKVDLALNLSQLKRLNELLCGFELG